MEEARPGLADEEGAAPVGERSAACGGGEPRRQGHTTKKRSHPIRASQTGGGGGVAVLGLTGEERGAAPAGETNGKKSEEGQSSDSGQNRAGGL